MATCALVGAVDFNAEDFKARQAAGEFDYVIAVDAGFAHLEAIGDVYKRQVLRSPMPSA